MAVPYAALTGPNGSFLLAAIAVLRTAEAAEQAPVRTRPPRGSDKAADNPHRQATVVQGILAAPTMIVPPRRQGKPRRRGAVPDHRKPKWN